MENLYEILLESSAPFLIAENGEWINADRVTILLEDMDSAYLKNCYKMMLRDEKAIKLGEHLNGVDRLFPILKDKMMKALYIKKCCVLFDQKLNELAKILNK